MKDIYPYLVTDDLLKLLWSISVLLFVLAGIALMVGGKRLAKRLMVYGVACCIFGLWAPYFLPLTIDLVRGLPFWVLFFLGALIAISLLQGFVALFLGGRAASAFAGNLAADVVRVIASALISPFRWLRRLLKGPDAD